MVSAVLGGRLEGGTETHVLQPVDRGNFEVKLEARPYLPQAQSPSKAKPPVPGEGLHKTTMLTPACLHREHPSFHGLNCILPNSYVEVPTLKCDHMWRQSLYGDT